MTNHLQSELPDSQYNELLAAFFDHAEAIPAVAIIVCVGVPVIATYWYKLEKHKADTELKRSMVERGMSAEEIERVLAAKAPEDKK